MNKIDEAIKRLDNAEIWVDEEWECGLNHEVMDYEAVKAFFRSELETAFEEWGKYEQSSKRRP